MKERAFVIGDIHGMDEALSLLLEKWDPNHESLIFLGDLIDRGPQIKAVLERVWELEDKYHSQVQVLMGNHEAMLLEYLQDPQQYSPRYFRNGGTSTLASLTSMSLEQIQRQSHQATIAILLEAYPNLKRWLEKRPVYLEFGPWLMVHAGVDGSLEDWTRTEISRFYWIREDFYGQNNKSNKQIIFGHTPTSHLLTNEEDWLRPWHNDNRYGIDGGAVYGGVLMGMHIDIKGQILGIDRIDTKANQALDSLPTIDWQDPLPLV